MPHWLEQILLKTIDLLFAFFPHRQPDPAKLKTIKIIAHRGAHSDSRPENSLAAIKHARDVGAWGVEYDVRWTLDDEPIVVHDDSAKRVFGIDLEFNQVTWSELHLVIEEIPHFATVLHELGTDIHHMIELKACGSGLTPARLEKLKLHLRQLQPITDFHFLSLTPKLLEEVQSIVPPQACLLVTDFQLPKFSRLALDKNWAGVAGHFALLSTDMIRTHKAAGQAVGIGYAATKNSLWRECHRDVDWIFTNHAENVIKILTAARRD